MVAASKRGGMAQIAIVGGGLSGLYAAALLEKHGLTDYLLLEASPSFGGRIDSVPSALPPLGDRGAAKETKGRFDLGATWFWPQLQPQLGRLVAELGLETFAQHEAGDMLIERALHQAPARMRGYVSTPPSMRIAGGMGALVDAIQRQLLSPSLFSGQRVRHLRQTEFGIELGTEDAEGRGACHRAAYVLLAVPPRLAATAIAFSPALPDDLLQDWRNTGTWMAPHAKYVALYDAPFWRENGLSGEARSAVGPLFEIHDALDPHGGAALFGFFGIPAEARRQVPEDALRAQCRAQLGRLFGPAAAFPKAEFVKDWARSPYTATTADWQTAAGHSQAPSPIATSGEWRDRIIGIASEWSPEFPGYVAGAIDAASRGVARLAHQIRSEAVRSAEESQ